jgi:uncharacterized protein (DUF302 family)
MYRIRALGQPDALPPAAGPRTLPAWIGSNPRDIKESSLTGLAIKKPLRASYEQALARVPEALKAEGFGVLTEIDVQGTLRDKLGVEIRRYKILGACNPPFAHQALQLNLQAGVMLPCNVVVYEDDDARAVVLAVDPTRAAAAAGDPRLAELAEMVKQKLTRALARLE